MALIWRGIFEVDDADFANRAAARVESWLRWKLRDNTIELPQDGALVEHASGCEITGRAASDGDLWGIRARSSYELPSRPHMTAMRRGSAPPSVFNQSTAAAKSLTESSRSFTSSRCV